MRFTIGSWTTTIERSWRHSIWFGTLRPAISDGSICNRCRPAGPVRPGRRQGCGRRHEHGARAHLDRPVRADQEQVRPPSDSLIMSYRHRVSVRSTSHGTHARIGALKPASSARVCRGNRPIDTCRTAHSGEFRRLIDMGGRQHHPTRSPPVASGTNARFIEEFIDDLSRLTRSHACRLERV
jgi:hypothetical protein